MHNYSVLQLTIEVIVECWIEKKWVASVAFLPPIMKGIQIKLLSKRCHNIVKTIY